MKKIVGLYLERNLIKCCRKLKNQESRKWIKEKLTEILGSKSFVYDKMSVIEALDSIEKHCYGITVERRNQS